MPTQNYDGSWTGDDGQPYDMISATNDAHYNARLWGDRTTDGPTPTPGSYDTAGLPPDIVANLLKQPGVRAGIAYFIAQGQRPNLNQVAALDQQIIPGYKNMGNEEVEDHSGRNLGLALAGVAGAGAFSGLTGFGSGLASTAGGGATSTLPSSAIDAGLFTAPSTVASGAVPAALAGGGDALATGAGSTLASMVPATTASSTAPSATSIVPNFIASNAPIAGASTATPTAAAATSFTAPSLINGMMSPKSAGIPSEFGQTPTDTVASNQSTTLPSAAISPSTTGVMQAPNTTSSMAFDAPGSTIGKITDSLGDVSKLLGNFSSGEKANRVVQGNATSRYDQQALADQTGRNQTESDALKKLAQTSYILSGGFKPQNTQITLNGQTRALPQIGQAPLPSSAAQIAGAQSLQDQLGARLAPGGTVAPSPKDEYGGTPGTAENIGSYGAVIAGMLPAAKTIYNMFS